MTFRKLITVARSFKDDVRGTISVADGLRSRSRLILDFALSRLIVLLPASRRNRPRQVRLRGDIHIRYRLNKGDLHAIREIWFQECYRLPFSDPAGVLLDLGANIGMTSLWLAKKYPLTHVIAVEPDPANAALARQNLAANGIAANVLEAAIGPADGSGRFAASEHSISGKMSEEGVPVPVVSVGTIIQKFAVRNFALVKIDIEGGEQPLFDGAADWLQHVDAIIIEFHPEIVDYPRLTKFVSSQGFRYIPANSSFPDNADCFVREDRKSVAKDPLQPSST
jgi:FkbM family methyltransferase